jgi:hypothetical protein
LRWSRMSNLVVVMGISNLLCHLLRRPDILALDLLVAAAKQDHDRVAFPVKYTR